jgi:hypothetical protein
VSARLARVSGELWLVIGIQSAGKSTVADLLASRFDPAVHVRGGQFYRWATRGWVHADDHERPEEARRLLSLRYRLSALVADEYCAEGFTTVVQDNIFGRDVVIWLDSIRARPRHLVVLRPSLDVVKQRDRERMSMTGKVAYRADSFSVEDLDRALESTPRIGLWLDTTHQTPEQTVDEIIARQAEAALPEATTSQLRAADRP